MVRLRSDDPDRRFPRGQPILVDPFLGKYGRLASSLDIGRVQGISDGELMLANLSGSSYEPGLIFKQSTSLSPLVGHAAADGQSR